MAGVEVGSLCNKSPLIPSPDCSYGQPIPMDPSQRSNRPPPSTNASHGQESHRLPRSSRHTQSSGSTRPHHTPAHSPQQALSQSAIFPPQLAQENVGVPYQVNATPAAHWVHGPNRIGVEPHRDQSGFRSTRDLPDRDRPRATATMATNRQATVPPLPLGRSVSQEAFRGSRNDRHPPTSTDRSVPQQIGRSVSGQPRAGFTDAVHRPNISMGRDDSGRPGILNAGRQTGHIRPSIQSPETPIRIDAYQRQVNVNMGAVLGPQQVQAPLQQDHTRTRETSLHGDHRSGRRGITGSRWTL
ncbi:hypothetical protein C8Q78DRAFT_9072 [Trametes maxima]|nr:hypothetical protein C8Q78DRAFT_9072 [Trametes maxima]